MRGLGDRLELDLGGRRQFGVGSRGGNRGGDRFDDLGHRRGLDHRLGCTLGGLRGLGGLLRGGFFHHGLFDGRLATQALGVGEAAHAVGERVVDARRVALHADLQALAQIEHDLVLDAKLSR